MVVCSSCKKHGSPIVSNTYSERGFRQTVTSTATSIVTLVQIGGGLEKPSGAIAASLRLVSSAWGAIFNNLKTNIASLTKKWPPVRYASTAARYFRMTRAEADEPAK